MRFSPSLAAAALLACAAPLSAQQPSSPPPGPAVGEAAPDFAAVPVSKDGTGKAFSLSKAKGETVVVAFFPRARTSGCTAQLTTYRDQYAQLFKGGKGVRLLAVSTDVDSTLVNWAREAGFPFQLVSDADGAIGTKYGAFNAGAKMDSRLLYVIGPDGTIVYTAKPFRPLAPEAYEAMGKAIADAAK